MLATVIEFSRYFAAFVFGIVVSVRFVGMPSTWRNHLVLACYTVVVFIVQVICLFHFGMNLTWKTYPIIAHLPIVLFSALYVKRSWLVSFTSMFAAFLCCQPPRWIGSVLGEIFFSVTMNHLGYIVSVVLMYCILKKYVVESVRHLMVRSVKSCLIFGAVPAIYYFVDYITTVYTNFLYSGTRAAVQFMPFIISAFYFVFVLFYYSEMQKQVRTARERDMLDMQFRQAQLELTSLRRMQQNASTYRHDMRHHFALLHALASNGQIKEMKDYIQSVQSDLNAITPIRFCEQEAVNLILSSFVVKAKQSGVQLTIDVRLPKSLPFSDTELCSLLSNALENAIKATEKIADKNERLIKLRLYSKNKKFCIDVRNRYETKPMFDQELPVSNEKGHGFGTKSMAYIIEKHGGVFQFTVKDDWFIFQATT